MQAMPRSPNCVKHRRFDGQDTGIESGSITTVPVPMLVVTPSWFSTHTSTCTRDDSALVALVTLATQIVRGSIDSAPLTNIVGANLLLANTFYAAAAVIAFKRSSSTRTENSVLGALNIEKSA